MSLRKTVLACVLLGAVVGLGFAPVSVPAQGEEWSYETYVVELTVSEEGTLESMGFRFVHTDQQFSERQSEAERAGYDSVATMAAEQFEILPQFEERNRESATVREVDDEYEVEVVYNISDSEPPEITAEKNGDTVRLEMEPQEYEENVEEVEIVDMPGEVVDSNADDVEGSVATWYVEAEMPDPQYVEADVGTEPSAADEATESSESGSGDDTDDEETERVKSDDGLPGFGLTIAALALIFAVAMLRDRRP